MESVKARSGQFCVVLGRSYTSPDVVADRGEMIAGPYDTRDEAETEGLRLIRAGAHHAARLTIVELGVERTPRGVEII